MARKVHNTFVQCRQYLCTVPHTLANCACVQTVTPLLCGSRTRDNTIGMTQKMNINLPTPTQFDGKNPQFNEWAGEGKANLTIHNVHLED
eukprot:1993008-Amphidinium_carterae.2